MSDLLNIGASAVRAYKGALGAIGENVANAETPGYARRSVVVKQAPTPGISPDPVYREQVLFSGVQIAGVQRAWDSFRAGEARLSAAAAGSADARSQWLTAVENGLSNGGTTVGSSLTAFFNAAAALAPSPGDPIARSSMLRALYNVGAAFRATGDALDRVANGIRTAAGLDVEAVNGALRALHDINGTIRSSTPGGAAFASLEDQRDRLIEDIATRVDVNVAIAGDGTATLALDGAAATPLLNGLGPGLLGLQVATDGRLTLQMTKEGTTAPLPVTSGKLAGLVQAAATTADRRMALDLLAADLTTSINAWSAAGIDANGAAGADLLDGSGGAAGLRTLTEDPDLIAAASTDGRANGNLLALDAMRGLGGLESRWNALVSDAAQSLSAAKSEAAAAASWRDNAYAALDEVTGVDLDREAAELLRYQQAYSAATRIIQVGRETVNAIIDLI